MGEQTRVLILAVQIEALGLGQLVTDRSAQVEEEQKGGFEGPRHEEGQDVDHKQTNLVFTERSHSVEQMVVLLIVSLVRAHSIITIETLNHMEALTAQLGLERRSHAVEVQTLKARIHDLEEKVEVFQSQIVQLVSFRETYS